MISFTEIKQGGSSASFTQTSAIPLTTIFTPNADCTAASAYDSTYWSGNQWAYQLDSGIKKSTCYPTSYRNYQYKSGLWYSPGVCPYSYEWVATSVQHAVSGPDTTLAICCPPHVQTVLSNGWSCYDVLTTLVDGGPSFSESGATAQPATTVYANPISVAWQESDLSLFSPASAPILALRSAGVTFPSSITPSTTSSSSVVPTNSSPTPTSHRGSGLSKGSAAGIGIGAAVACIALCGGLWYFGRRLKLSRSEKLRVQQDIHNGRGSKLEDPRMALRNEISEADAAHFISELDGGWQPPEAIGSVTIKPTIEKELGGNIR